MLAVRADKPSGTARFVAAMRTLGIVLPDEAQLADDRPGVRILVEPLTTMATLSRRAPSLRPLLRAAVRPLLSNIVGMQVRTRLIDDAARAFVAAGGRQLVILGAGYDARAARLALDGARFFEVDHPATQRWKHERMGVVDGVAYLPWDFERDAMHELPARLAALGLSRAQPTLTIWEGVTMYLAEEAIAATVAAVRAWSAPGSRLSFLYFDRRWIDEPTPLQRFVALGVRVMGEPLRFGWDPPALPGWLAAHGLRLVADDDISEAARRMLPPRWARLLRRARQHMALAAID